MRSTGETTNGAFALTEHWMMPPGFASPYHTHHLEDEAFYVLEGQVAFVCDGKWSKAGPGTYVFGPREIPNGFKIIGNGPSSWATFYDKGVTAQVLARRRRTADLLRALGVDVVDASAEQLPPALADHYLALKARGLL